MASLNQISKNSDFNMKIISFNVRGIRNQKKRRTLFHLFKRNKYDVICLQETHLVKNDLDIIKKDWGSEFHLAEGTTNSKGLLTLFGNGRLDFDCFLIKENDRCLVSRLQVDDSIFFVFNVYAPCIIREKHVFLNNISDIVAGLQLNDDSNRIILGDFNMVRDNELDIISGEYHDVNMVNKFKSFSNELLLTDIWRHLNGRKKEYSWCKKILLSLGGWIIF